MNIITLDSTPSTNSAADRLGDTAAHGTVVTAHTQTAGRGQRGNTWEAAPGQNLTFTVVLRPWFMPASRQFELSMLVSIAVTNVLTRLIGSDDVMIKWPNDIYWHDRKLAGILIENTVSGSDLRRSLVGIGLNVNQTEFLSDAPNPVSLKQITGQTYPLEPLLSDLAESITSMVSEYCDSPEPDELQALYMSRLWRNDARMHTWCTPDGHTFSAAISGVGIDGMLTLRMPSGTEKSFAFKEVAAVLS